MIINDPDKLKRFYEEHKGVIWAGYNSRNYDQYILKAILCGFDPKPVNDWIIAEDKPGYRYSSLFREYPLINYDVMPNPPISLKALEAFMGHSIKETSVPFDIDRPLTEAELAETVKYCRHDVEQTVEVWLRRKEDEFDAQMSLVKAFHLPISDIGRTKAQLSAKILGAVQREHNDEFEIEFPPSLRIEKYTEVLNWYKNPLNRDYSKTLELDVAGVPHVFAWGGLHGAIPKYHGEGWFVNVDVASYGADGSEATLKIQGGQQRLRIKLGGTDYAVYHEGSKPTPADIGAIPFDDSRADIPEGADLNSYTAVGVYRCKNNATAGSLTNSPTTEAFVMDVVPSTGTSRALDGNYAYLIQKIMTNGNRYYARKVSTNGNVSTPIYGAWIEFYTTQNKPALADIGAARLICGSYIGTGTAGVSNPCSITFEAAPKLIYLLGSKKPNGVFTWYSLKDHSDSSGHYLWGIYMGALTTVYTENTGFLTDSTELGATSYGKKSSDGKTYYWYVDMASLSSSQQAYGPGLQCNVSGNTYYYAALC